MSNFTIDKKKFLSLVSRQVKFVITTIWNTEPTESEWDIKATFHHQLLGYEQNIYEDRLDNALPKLLELMEEAGVSHISLSKTGGFFPIRS